MNQPLDLALAALSPASRKKLDAIRESADRLADMASGLTRRASQEREDRLAIEARLAKYDDEIARTGRPPTKTLQVHENGRSFQRIVPDPDRRKAIVKDLDAAKARHARREREAQEVLDTRVGPSRALVSRAERYLAQVGAAGAAQSYAGHPVKLKAATDLPGRLEDLRGQIAAKASEMQSARGAPFPSSEVKAAIAARIGRLAEAGRPDVRSLFFDPHHPPAWATMQQTLHSVDGEGRRGLAMGQVLDPMATLAWLYETDLVEALGAEIDALADDSQALGADERATRIAALQVEILALERQEEAVIDAAAVQGVELARRANADPRAVLALSADLPPPTA